MLVQKFADFQMEIVPGVAYIYVLPAMLHGKSNQSVSHRHPIPIMRQRLIILSCLIIPVVSVFGQNNNESIGKKRARQELKSALSDTTQHNVISSNFIVLDNKEKAVKFAEQILFDIYSKKQIENEKPYEVYNIDGYWIISGTLPKGWEGGTFLIIVDSHDCRIIRLTHGK